MGRSVHGWRAGPGRFLSRPRCWRRWSADVSGPAVRSRGSLPLAARFRRGAAGAAGLPGRAIRPVVSYPGVLAGLYRSLASYAFPVWFSALFCEVYFPCACSGG